MGCFSVSKMPIQDRDQNCSQVPRLIHFVCCPKTKVFACHFEVSFSDLMLVNESNQSTGIQILDIIKEKFHWSENSSLMFTL